MSEASGFAKRPSINQVFALLRQRYGWQLNHSLGHGGFNYVFREEIGGLPRAVKISKDPVEVDEHEWRSLEIVRHLNGHPRLLTLIQYEQTLGYVVTVWELAEGSLQDRLEERLARDQGPFSAQELLGWMQEAAEGIDALNARGICHQDIKPANLLLVRGHVKIGDLGLAKLAGASTRSHTRGLGTPGFLPPEGYEGRLVPWIDVYGLCASYVHLRTGKLPFGSNVLQVLERQRNGEYERDGLTAGEIRCLDRVLGRGAGPSWGDRGARAWLEELRQALQQGSAARSGQESGASDGPIVGAITGGIVGAICGAIGWAIAGAIGGGIFGAIVGAITLAIGGAIDGAITPAIGLAIFGALYGAIRGASDGPIARAIYGAIAGAIGGAIFGASGGASDGGILWGILGGIGACGSAAKSDNSKRPGQESGASDGPIWGAIGSAIFGAIFGAITGIGSAIGWAIGGAIGSAIAGAIAGGILGGILGLTK